jgi:lysophospholipase L1-like esterase
MSAASNSRRSFIKKTTLAGIAVTGIQSLAAANFKTGGKEDHLNFLFQGDSITDGNRGRDKDPNHIMGHGYAFSISSRVGASFPEKANTFYNRGISGNGVVDLLNRWQTDTLDLKPAVLSILVGINDTDSVVKQQHIVTPEKYEEVYRLLLTQTRAQLPGCLLVLCEPFILPVGRVKENWKVWNDDMQQRQAVVSHLAKEFDTVFVPLQKIFTDATKQAAVDYWIWDGIHPTYSGHELITREWLKQVSKRLHFLKNMPC